MVSDSTMENTLFRGDIVLVNKLSIGARTPITLLCLPFLGFDFCSTFIELPYFRLPSWSSISHNDIICFNNPIEDSIAIDLKKISFHRCIGLPGDTVVIRTKKFFINGDIIDNSEFCKFRYRIMFINQIPEDFYKSYSIHQQAIKSLDDTYDFFLTYHQYQQLTSDSNVKEIHLLKVNKTNLQAGVFPHHRNYNWNSDYFGPIIIPSKGETVNLNSENISLYKAIIEKYEHNKLEIKNDSILINDSLSNTYTFKMDYYFVLDDNRDKSYDSRTWGFLPESHIVGEASLIWFSIDRYSGTTDVRWNRIFKMI
jgi:signal peptidase I